MTKYSNDDQIVIFPNDKVRDNPKAPNWYGHATISSETLTALNQLAASGQEVKIRVACWEKQSPKIRGTFLSGKVSLDNYGGRGSGQSYREAPPRERETAAQVRNDLDSDTIPF